MSMNLLEKNVGQKDKYIRIGAGSLLIVLAGTGAIGAWGFIGLIPLATGLLGTCPAYTLLGKSTVCSHEHSSCCGSAAASEPPASAEPAAPAEPAVSSEAAAPAEESATSEANPPA